MTLGQALGISTSSQGGATYSEPLPCDNWGAELESDPGEAKGVSPPWAETLPTPLKTAPSTQTWPQGRREGVGSRAWASWGKGHLAAQCPLQEGRL